MSDWQKVFRETFFKKCMGQLDASGKWIPGLADEMMSEIESIMKSGTREEKMWATEKILPYILGPKSDDGMEAPNSHAPFVITVNRIENITNNNVLEPQKPIIQIEQVRQGNNADNQSLS